MRTKEIKVVANATLGCLETIQVFLMNKLTGEPSQIKLCLIAGTNDLSVINEETEYELTKLYDEEIAEDMRQRNIGQQMATVLNPDMSDDGASVFFSLRVPLSDIIQQSPNNEESALLKELFSLYSPEEIQKACFLNNRYTGSHRSSEEIIFSDNFMKMDIEALYSLPTEEQDTLAKEWKTRLEKADCANPNEENMASRCLIPHDLEVYGYTWETLPLPVPDDLLLGMLLDNLALIQYINMCNETGIIITPSDFKASVLDFFEDSTEKTYQRIINYYNKIESDYGEKHE